MSKANCRQNGRVSEPVFLYCSLQHIGTSLPVTSLVTLAKLPYLEPSHVGTEVSVPYWYLIKPPGPTQPGHLFLCFHDDYWWLLLPEKKCRVLHNDWPLLPDC